MSDTPARRQFALFLLGALPCLLFALVTDHRWEDWYITFRAGKNLALGNGLVFEPGQILQTFTSPFNVMIPSGLSWLTGNTHDDVVLWLYRLICAAFLGGTVVLLDRLARQQNLAPAARWFLIGSFLIDAKTIDFSINGQEAAFLVFFLALQIVALLERRTLMLGVAWGGLMWSRPDSFVYVGGVSAGYLLHLWLHERATLPATLKPMARAALIGSLIYAPWLIGTYWYYGSPIPHTIVAKGLNASLSLTGKMEGLFLLPVQTLLGQPSVLNRVFMPTYYDFGGWPVWLLLGCRLLALLAAMVWLLPRMPALVRIGSLGAFAGAYYLQCFPPYAYPWYFPSCTFLSTLALAGLLDHGLRQASGGRSLKTAAALLVLMGLGVTACMALEMRTQQQLVEYGERKPIGLWLKQHASSPHDTVFLECLGYIGFYSNLKMYDYPGMSSPEMVEARSRYGENPVLLISALAPDWIVLRASEADVIFGHAPALNHYYQPVQSYDETAAIKAVGFLPGRGYLQYDRSFIIFHRIAPLPR